MNQPLLDFAGWRHVQHKRSKVFMGTPSKRVPLRGYPQAPDVLPQL